MRNRLDANFAMTHAFFKAQIHLLRLCTLSAPSCQLVLYLISAFRTSLPCSGKESTTTKCERVAISGKIQARYAVGSKCVPSKTGM
jgi:hypothetical protein